MVAVIWHKDHSFRTVRQEGSTRIDFVPRKSIVFFMLHLGQQPQATSALNTMTTTLAIREYLSVIKRCSAAETSVASTVASTGDASK